MKVHFCDLCNESVPQADLDQGRARVLKGRVVCASCDRSMTVGDALSVGSAVSGAGTVAVAERATEPLTVAPQVQAAPAPAASPYASEPRSVVSHAPIPAASGSSTGLWVAVVGLLFTAGAIYVFDRRLGELSTQDRKFAGDVGEQAGKLAAVEKSIGRVDSDIAAAKETTQRDRALESARVWSQVNQLDASLKDARKELAGIATALESLRKESATGQADWARRIDEISQRVAKQDDAFREQATKLAEVEELALNPPVAPAPVAVGGAPAQPAEAPWKGLLADLANANSGLRWQAVDGLGQSGDPEAVPHVIPLLKDADVFVRMAAARVLGNLNAPKTVLNVDASVGALIDALEDVDSPVRVAALVALRQITERDLQFDPDGNEGDRSRKLKAIRDWWRRTTETGGFKRDAAIGN